MNKLTESSVRKAKILEKQYKMYDGDGMFLLIHPNGSKYWRMKYTFDGKSKLASFGVWPNISLKKARESRYDAKQKIKLGINPVEEKRKNKRLQHNQSSDKVKSEYLKSEESSGAFHQWFRNIFPQRREMSTEKSLNMLKSNIFGNTDRKNYSFLDKQGLNEILVNIYRNRSSLFEIACYYYLSFPPLNIIVLFVLLLIIMDFFPALFTTVLYLFLTVCTAFAFGLWEEKKNE